MLVIAEGLDKFIVKVKNKKIYMVIIGCESSFAFLSNVDDYFN